MFVEKSKKIFTDILLQRLTVGWVEPYNNAFSIFPSVFIIVFAVDNLVFHYIQSW